MMCGRATLVSTVGSGGAAFPYWAAEDSVPAGYRASISLSNPLSFWNSAVASVASPFASLPAVTRAQIPETGEGLAASVAEGVPGRPLSASCRAP